MIAVYFINREQWKDHNDAQIKINFWLRNLKELQQKLDKLNIPLVVLEADNYEKTIKALHEYCETNSVKNLYFNVEYPINELKRDREIFVQFKEHGIGVFPSHDQVIHEPGSLKTKAGTNFSVYSPFKRKWFEELEEDQLELLGVPEKKANLNIQSTDLTNYLQEYS